jgi:MFS family permease
VAGVPRSVYLLSALFATSGLAGIIVVAAASVVGLGLSGREDLATLPVALAMLGTMAATVPAAKLMATHGRRIGFVAGTSVGIAGAALAALGIALGSFVLFCVGSLLLGGLNGVAPFYRFTAVELTPPEARGRAISTVLAGGIVAGLVGPPLGAAARDWAPASPFVGSYILMVLLGLLLLLTIPVARMPPPPPRGVPRTGRPLREIAEDRRFVGAVVAAAMAMGAMVITMVAAPLSIKHAGHAYSVTAFVIQAHVVAMYLPAFFSGRLVEHYGTGRMMAVGLALLMACVAVNLAGVSAAHHWVALVLLGIGWNFLFVAGTSQLTTTHTDAEKGTVQGFNDFVVAGTGAAAALGAGPLLDAIGWRGLNLVVAGAVALTAAVLLAMRRPARRGPPAPAGITAVPLDGVAPAPIPPGAPRNG